MEQLGIQPLQILMQIINFVVLLFILKKFLYAPVMKALDARRKKIDEGLKFSSQMKEEVEKTEKKKNEIFQEARDEVRVILTEAKKNAKGIEAEIIKKAQKEASQMLEAAKRDIESEQTNMERELKKQTVEISMIIVEKVLNDVLEEKNQRTLIDKKIKQLSRFSS